MTKGFAVLGLGTIGSGVFELWGENHALIGQRGAADLRLAAVADVRQPAHLDLGTVRYSEDARELIGADDVHIVVELIGGTGIAHELVKEALQAGKSVVTANKALIAKHGDELHHLAHQSQAHLAYEASVCGGIPLLGALKHGLVANQISSITGTVNGTCNYILTRMLQENMDFAEALEAAQQLGFAEADPRFDIDGIDSAHKTTILAGLAFGTGFELDSCLIKGIREVSLSDLQHCEELGYRLMHLSHCQTDGNGVLLGAFPGLVQSANILAQTFMEMNAAVAVGNGVGATFYHGAGAGARPTASAVIADVVDIAARLGQPYQGRPRWRDPAKGDARPMDFNDGARRWYVRYSTDAAHLGECEERLVSRGVRVEQRRLYSSASGEYIAEGQGAKGECDVIVLTDAATESALQEFEASTAIKRCQRYPIVELP